MHNYLSWNHPKIDGETYNIYWHTPGNKFSSELMVGCESGNICLGKDLDKIITIFHLDTPQGREVFQEMYCRGEETTCQENSEYQTTIIYHDPFVSYDIATNVNGLLLCRGCYAKYLLAVERAEKRKEDPTFGSFDSITIKQHRNSFYRITDNKDLINRRDRVRSRSMVTLTKACRKIKDN